MPEIYWATGHLSSFRAPSGHGEALSSYMIVKLYEGRYGESTNVRLPNIDRSMLTFNMLLEIAVERDAKSRGSSKESPTPDIEIVRATAFHNLLASNVTFEIFALRLWPCSEQLGVTVEVTTLNHPGEMETIDRGTG